MMRNFRFFLILGLISIAFLQACNEKPTDISMNLLNETVEVKAITNSDTTMILRDSVYRPMYPLLNTSAILVGKSNGVTASALIRFGNIPDSLSYLKSTDIESVTLALYPLRYAYGDTNSGNFGFKIYKVNRRWTSDTTSYDSLFVTPKNYFDNLPIASYSGKMSLKDTMNPIKIELSKDLIVDWFRTVEVKDVNGNKIKDSVLINWGIAIVPDDNSSVIYSYHAQGDPNFSTLSSLIRVNYKNKNSIIDSCIMSSAMDVAYMSSTKPDGEIVLQNGVNWWTKLFIDIRAIPKLSGIHKAQLELFLDSSKSYSGNNGLDSLIQLYLFYNDDYKSPAFQWTGYRVTGTNKYIVPSITSAIQNWNLGVGFGEIVILPVNQQNLSREVDRLVFYGINNPDKSKRPQLKIFYSLNPNKKL